MYAILKRLQKPVELIHIAGSKHMVTQPWASYTSQQGSVDWYAFWLLGEEDPDPAKSADYVRWRMLKRQQHAQTDRCPPSW
jgi:hypothetical protein